MFYEKELQKTNQTEFRIEKVTKKRVINYMLHAKIIHLIVRLIKKISLYKMSYFQKLYDHSRNERKLELDLSIYATYLT